jgi:hypothetical protein
MKPSRPAAATHASPERTLVQRTQTGVRLESRLLKVLKALAEYHDLTLGDLLEGIVLHAFEGKPPFGPEGRQRIREFKRIYGLTLDASHSHRLGESRPAPRSTRSAPAGSRKEHRS